VMSVLLLGRRLNRAQWSSLVMISFALVLATLAEGKGKKGGEWNLIGPLLLLLSELFHATFLVLQEVSVRKYWSDPLALLSASAFFGVLMTGLLMVQARQVLVPMPGGGTRPTTDITDAFVMCVNNPVLGVTMVLHLATHVSNDMMHIVILKHISALARTLCDAVKLILMWFCGKAFWLCGTAPYLAEEWHPGVVGSWLMLPAIPTIMYGMMMFKNKVFKPIGIVREGGVWRVVEYKVKLSDEEHARAEAAPKVSLDDPFFMGMFRSKILRQQMQTRAHKDPVQRIRSSVPMLRTLSPR